MKYIFIMSLFLFASCKKESNTISNTIFINPTAHQIRINAFKNGDIQLGSSFDLSPGENKNVFYLNNRGIGIGLTYGGINQPLDSIQVIFDDLNFITHYKKTLVGTNPKNYLYNSRRNIFNDSSYLSSLLQNSQYIREWQFTYSFTEQDFIDTQ